MEKQCWKTLFSTFDDASHRFPDKCAVISNEAENKISSATYLEVSKESAKICTSLQELSIRDHSSEKVVGLCLEQCLCVPAIILGILKSGAAFMCLDPNKPENQLTQLNIKWVFTNSQCRPHFMKTAAASNVLKTIQVHGITVDLWEITFCPDNECLINHISNLAYAITTSGTTGAPKLIQVPHSCIIPNITHLRDIFGVQPDDIILLASPLTFDPSIVELFLALSTGASLLIVSDKIKASPRTLLDVLFPKAATYRGVTILQCTPSIISRWSLEEINVIVLGPSSTLRTLVLGGEPCPDLNILNQWRSTDSKTDIYNIYGITEVSCWASICKVDFNNKIKSVPLGTPLSETLIRVQNRYACEVKEGIGELFIGSNSRICVLHEEKEDIARGVVFRGTGDLVNVDSAAKTITYVGRKDSMIKRWGHRVSLSQVEQVAGRQNDVESCCCVWDENSYKLALFIKKKANASLGNYRNEIALRSYLAKNILQASMPDEIRFVSTFPLTNHGKIDKKLLVSQLLLELKAQQTILNPCEECYLKNLWVKCLNLGSCDFDPNKSFLLLGGNSFISLQLTTELANFGLRFSSDLVTVLLKGATYNEFWSCINSTLPNVSSSTLLKKHDSQSDNLSTSICKRVKRNLIDGAGDGTKYDFSSYSMCRGKVFDLKDQNGYTLSRNQNFSKVNVDENIQLDIGWKFDLGKCIDASPLLIKQGSNEGIIVIGSHSHRLAILDVATGNPIVPICSLNDRIESSACVSLCGTKIFVGCYDGKMHCFDVTSGERVWQYQTGGMIKCTPALCLDGTAVTFGAYDNVLYCLGIEDGSIIWQMQPGSGSIYSSPCVSLCYQLIYAACLDGTSCAVTESDGKVVWLVKLDSPVFSSPALICKGSQLVIAEVSGLVHGLSSTLGDKMWTCKAGGNIFSSFCTPVLNANTLVIFGCHDKHVYCLEQSHIHGIMVKWKTELDSATFATPFSFPIQTLSSNSTRLIVIASTKGCVYLIDVDNGLIKARHSIESEIYSSPIVYNNQIIVGCRDNNIYSLNIV